MAKRCVAHSAIWRLRCGIISSGTVGRRRRRRERRCTRSPRSSERSTTNRCKSRPKCSASRRRHCHATLPCDILLLLCYALHPAYTTTLTAQHAEAKLKAARIAAQTRLVEARVVLERQCEARLAEAAQQAAAQLEAVRAAARPEDEVALAPQLGLVELLEGQARPRARMGLGLG